MCEISLFACDKLPNAGKEMLAWMTRIGRECLIHRFIPLCGMYCPEMMGYADDKLFNCRDTHLNDPAARQLMDIAALNPSYDLSIYARGMD
jgi:hypothetical protein